MKRSEVENKYKWELTHVLASDEEWEKLFAALKTDMPAISAYMGKLGNKDDLLSCFKERDKLGLSLEKLYGYAHMKSDEDTKNDTYKGFRDRAYGLYVGFMSAASYITPELTALPEDVLKGFIADADFSDYDYQLSEVVRQKAHILSDKEERLLAMSADFAEQFYNVFNMIDNADVKFKDVKNEKGEKVKLSHGVYSVLLQSGDRRVRADAFKSMYAFFKGHVNTIAANYTGYVKKNLFYAQARGYKSSLEFFTDNDNVPAEVYKKLVGEVGKATPSVHEYVSRRNEIIGKAEEAKTGKPYRIHMYDMYTPLVPGAEITLSYEEAYNLVLEALKPMGEEYINLLKEAYAGGWIDVAETENKRGGAYCSGLSRPHPFVLLNYQKTTHDVFTIAHEMGHALHSWYSQKTQPVAKSDYAIFVAEVASTVNEVLLLKHLIKVYENNADVKRYLLSYYMDMFRTTIFRQTMFAEFELWAHEAAERGEPLTPESLNKRYYELNKRYYGKGVIHDKDIAFEWSRIPHFYMGFYVYKYATGLTSAVCIAEDILSRGKPAVERYVGFLSSGGCASPYEILKRAGVDLMTDRPYEIAMGSFKEALRAFAAR